MFNLCLTYVYRYPIYFDNQNMQKTTQNAKKMQKNLVMSKKSSTFARFFVDEPCVREKKRHFAFLTYKPVLVREPK